MDTEKYPGERIGQSFALLCISTIQKLCCGDDLLSRHLLWLIEFPAVIFTKDPADQLHHKQNADNHEDDPTSQAGRHKSGRIPPDFPAELCCLAVSLPSASVSGVTSTAHARVTSAVNM